MRFIAFACAGFLVISNFAFSQAAPVPLVNNPLQPPSTAPGGPTFTLTVNGTGFQPDSVVAWKGKALSTTFVNPSQLTATVPATNIAVPGTFAVSVLTPGAPKSNVEYFGVRQPFSAVSFSTSYFKLPDVYLEQFFKSIIAIDVNDDGNLDLLVLSYSYTSPSVMVLLGKGDGTFAPAVAYPVIPQFGLDMVTGDFNNDGKLDVAVLSTNPNGEISTLLGNGDGTFQPYLLDVFTSSQCFCGTLETGDFNGDGKQDLLVTDYFSMDTLLGNGDGTFQAPITSSGRDPRAVADVNGDGKLDILGYDGGIAFGNGDGTFGPGSSMIDSYSGAIDAILADFNGDGKLDGVACGYGSPPWYASAFILSLGNGDGTFQSGGKNYSTSNGNGLVTAADLNGDGNLDAIRVGGGIGAFLGNGDGTFQAPHDIPVSTAYEMPAIPGDFNNDGLLDLVTATPIGVQYTTIYVLLQSTSVLSSQLVHFNPIRVGSTGTAYVQLNNIGENAFTINSIQVTGTEAAYFHENNNCGSSLPAGASCTISIVFKPPTVGSFNATVEVADSAAKSKQPIVVAGVGD